MSLEEIAFAMADLEHTFIGFVLRDNRWFVHVRLIKAVFLINVTKLGPFV